MFSILNVKVINRLLNPSYLVFSFFLYVSLPVIAAYIYYVNNINCNAR